MKLNFVQCWTQGGRDFSRASYSVNGEEWEAIFDGHWTFDAMRQRLQARLDAGRV